MTSIEVTFRTRLRPAVNLSGLKFFADGGLDGGAQAVRLCPVRADLVKEHRLPAAADDNGAAVRADHDAVHDLDDRAGAGAVLGW